MTSIKHKKGGGDGGEGLICDPRDKSLQGLHLIHMIILKYNVLGSNVLALFSFSFFQGLIDESAHICFSSIWGRGSVSCNLSIGVRFLKLTPLALEHRS